jgi:hypothetical protein
MLHGYTDSDWMGSTVDQKSTFRYCFSLGSAMIPWSNRKQGSIAQSTTEAEYIAASAASREAVWLKKILSDLFSAKMEPTLSHCHNQSCIKLFENLVFHDISKHIEMIYHYVRDMVQKNILSIDTAKNRKSSHVHDIILIEFDYPQGIQIRNQNRHVSLGTQPAKNRKLSECP